MVDQLRHASAWPCNRRGTGLISGTPTAAGQFDFQVLAKVNADTRSDTKVLGIVVREQLGVLGAEPFTTARRATGEVSLPFDATLTATGGTRHVRVVADERRAPTGSPPRGRRDLGDAHDRRRLRLHRDRHRHRRTSCQLSGAHRHRGEARRLDAAPPSRAAGGLLPGQGQDHRRCPAANVENRPRPAAPRRSLRPHGRDGSSGSRRARAAFA